MESSATTGEAAYQPSNNSDILTALNHIQVNTNMEMPPPSTSVNSLNGVVALN